MANMSYCRFRNTNGDLYDCNRALHDELEWDGEQWVDSEDDGNPLNRDEAAALDEIADQCREILIALESAGYIKNLETFIGSGQRD